MQGVLVPKKLPAGLSAFMTTGEGPAFTRRSFASGQSVPELEALGIKNLVTLHQVHGSDVIKVGLGGMFAANGAEADGLFTKERGLALGILTADCFPVLLAGERHIAALHCGWRSTVHGIIEKAAVLFEKADDRPSYAYVGAGISADSFEVKEDFTLAVSGLFSPEPWLKRKDSGLYFDLEGLITDKLVQVGLRDIECAGLCTVKDERFFSYRRAPGELRRMLSIIMWNNER